MSNELFEALNNLSKSRLLLEQISTAHRLVWFLVAAQAVVLVYFLYRASTVNGCG